MNYESRIKNIINKHLDSRKNKAFIFGSRANQSFSKFSDCDIGIEGEELNSELYFNLLNTFEQSDLPFRIDIVEFRDVSESFRKIAKQKIIPLN